MKKPAEKADAFLDLIVDWQEMENGMIKYAEGEAAKEQNALQQMMAKVMGLEARKRCLIQQMIVESVNKEAANMDPEEIEGLTGLINRVVETEEKKLPLAETALEKSELYIPRFLLSYLIDSIKKENELLRQFSGQVKASIISTSVTSKIYGPGQR